MTRKFCDYCGTFLYDTVERSYTYSRCKYSRPDCTLEMRNFNASLQKAESSDNQWLRNMAKEVRIRLESGETPKSIKPFLKIVIRKKTPEKFYDYLFQLRCKN